jgi:dCTP deaminase
MILSNVDIHAAIDNGSIVIKPVPSPRFPSIAEPKCPYASTSLDLTLSSRLSRPKKVAGINLDLRNLSVAPTLAALYDDVVIDPNNGYILEPNQFILGNTVEWVHLPVREGHPALAARVEGKSSRARMGILVHFTAPTIHAGFEGNITLEMINLGPFPLTLFPGVPICQLIFERVQQAPVKFAASQSQGQSAPVGLK